MEDLSNSIVKLPLGKGVRLLRASNGLIALEKPDAVRSHPNRDGKIDLEALLLAPYDTEAEAFVVDGSPVYLLNRLDSPTSGVILLASDSEVAKQVKSLFAVHKVEKTYFALVYGRAGRLKQTWRDRIRVTRQGGALRAVTGSGDPALTNAKAVEESQNGFPLTLLELRPETGRTHQLRVQCASRRMPIVGDATYGDFAFNRRIAKELKLKRLCLHAAKIQLQLKLGASTVSFTAASAMPAEFKRALSR